MFSIPNILTLCNLFCGCLGLVAIWEGKQPIASYLILLGACFDVLDGLVARMLKSYSELGKQLDSLADMTTFGVLPALLMFDMMRYTVNNVWATLGFMLALFAALRLAKFNIDERQSRHFIGLPSPAMAIAVASLPLIAYYQPFSVVLLNYNILGIFTILLSWVMVAEIPLFSFKFKTWDWETNRLRYMFLILCCISVFLLGILVAPFLILLYIAWSIAFQSLLLRENFTHKPLNIMLETSTHIEDVEDPEDIMG